LHAPIAFEIVNDGGEMDLEFDFGKLGPLHRAKKIAVFSGNIGLVGRSRLDLADDATVLSAATWAL
jgi:hypothetical protein